MSAALLSLVLVAGVRLPAVEAVGEALRRGDRVEAERLARRVGAARLARLARAESKGRAAAVEALPWVADAWEGMPAIVGGAGQGEGRRPAALLRRLREAIARVAEARAQGDEIPDDPLRAVGKALLSLAARGGAPGATRAEALAAYEDLRSVVELAEAPTALVEEIEAATVDQRSRRRSEASSGRAPSTSRSRASPPKARP